MGQMIQKSDANPILYAVANLFVFGALGYLLMGQQKKAILAAVITIGLSMFTCGFGSIVAFVFVYDAYLLGEKLQKGQAIGENENALEFLNAIFKD